MVIGVDNGGAIKTRLLANDDDDVVAGFADFKGRRAIRSKTGLWKSAYFIIGTICNFFVSSIYSNVI